MPKIIKFLFASFILPTIFLTQIASATLGDTGNSGSSSCVRLPTPLTYGNRDTEANGNVTALQTFLYDNGYLTVNPTGFFGTNTRKAVRDFQSEVLSNVQVENIDSSIITSSTDRNELARIGFRLSNTGYVGMYTRAKIAYVTCLGGDNLTDNNGNNNGNNGGGNVASSGILDGPSSCIVPTYDSSSISNSQAAANGTCEITLTWNGAQAPLSSKLIKWQLEGSDFWSGNITLADGSLVSKSKKFILGQNNMTVAISSNGQNVATKVIAGICASGAERDTSNGRCIVSNSQLGSSLAIITMSLPNVAVGADYTYPIISTGGTGVRDWNITSGMLPTGLYLNKTMCAISSFGGCSQGMSIGFGGTATNAGTYTFTITATAGIQSISKQFTLTVGSGSPVNPNPGNVASTHKLPPTGITFYGDANNINANASVATDAGEYPRQDARYAKPFDYTKIANDGSVLPVSAVLGTGAKDWACTKDNITGMIWEVKTTSGLRSMDNTYLWPASDFPTAVNSSRLCGLSNWRVPTIKELEGIVDFSKNKVILSLNDVVPPRIDSTFFPNTSPNQYWASTKLAEATDQAWYVDFGVGYSQIYSTLTADGHNSWRVRLVSGATAPSNHLVNNGNGTITDTNTSLMWKRDYEMLIPGSPVSWNDCISAAKPCDWFLWQDALKRAVDDRTGGYSDWRVPNIKELRSLTDESRIYPALNLGFFPAPLFQASFWSNSPASDVHGNMGLAWSLASNYGQVDPPTTRTSRAYVRLVRDTTSGSTGNTESNTGSNTGNNTGSNGGVLAITTTSLVHVRAANAYNYEQALTYSGGTGSPTWSLVSGALPGGMVLNPTTGIIKTNTFPQPNGPTVGLYNFTVGLTVGSQNVTKQLSIDIISSTDPKPVLSDLKYYAYKDAYLSVVGDHSINIKGTLGFSDSVTCSMVDGLLPDGVSFDATNCKIIGIPRATGTFTMTLKVQNQYGSDTSKVILEITNPARIRILTGSLPDATVGQPYNTVVNFQADPGIVGMYQSGDRIILPNGLSYVYTTGELSAVIRGTPIQAGTYQVPISVSAGGNTNIGETKIFSLLVKLR